MGKGLIVLIVIVLILLMFGGMYVSSKNQMVAKNETIKSNFAEVDNNMKRRADLIPNLVETVKGIAGQEQKVFGEIAQARSQLLNAQRRLTRSLRTTKSPVRSDACLPLRRTIRNCARARTS